MSNERGKVFLNFRNTILMANVSFGHWNFTRRRCWANVNVYRFKVKIVFGIIILIVVERNIFPIRTLFALFESFLMAETSIEHWSGRVTVIFRDATRCTAMAQRICQKHKVTINARETEAKKNVHSFLVRTLHRIMPVMRTTTKKTTTKNNKIRSCCLPARPCCSGSRVTSATNSISNREFEMNEEDRTALPLNGEILNLCTILESGVANSPT